MTALQATSTYKADSLWIIPPTTGKNCVIQDYQ